MSVRRRCGVWSGVVCVHACYISAVSWRVRARSGRSHTLWWRGRDWPWRTDSSELLVASSGREWQSQSEETGAGTAHKVDGHTTHPGFTKTITQGSQMRCSASGAKNERKWSDLLGPQNRPYRPTTTATATIAITGSARVASVGFHGVYELAVYANMDPIRSAYAKVPSRRAR